eukprot:5981009-Prymnesium_polylepis.2
MIASTLVWWAIAAVAACIVIFVVVVVVIVLRKSDGDAPVVARRVNSLVSRRSHALDAAEISRALELTTDDDDQVRMSFPINRRSAEDGAPLPPEDSLEPPARDSSRQPSMRSRSSSFFRLREDTVPAEQLSSSSADISLTLSGRSSPCRTEEFAVSIAAMPNLPDSSIEHERQEVLLPVRPAGAAGRRPASRRHKQQEAVVDMDASDTAEAGGPAIALTADRVQPPSPIAPQASSATSVRQGNVGRGSAVTAVGTFVLELKRAADAKMSRTGGTGMEIVESVAEDETLQRPKARDGATAHFTPTPPRPSPPKLPPPRVAISRT